MLYSKYRHIRDCEKGGHWMNNCEGQHPKNKDKDGVAESGPQMERGFWGTCKNF
jgi:hypothetical protein